MENIENRAVIKYLSLKKKINDMIKTELTEVDGDTVPSLSTIWGYQFRND